MMLWLSRWTKKICGCPARLIFATDYYGEVSQAITRTMALISPVVLIVMGTLTGFIVWAMLSAVFSVNEAIK